MPRLKNTDEAIKQIMIAASIIAEKLKLAKGQETTIGKGTLDELLGSMEGKGLKPILTQAIKKFGITKFYDAKLQYVFTVVDPEKPVLRVKRL